MPKCAYCKTQETELYENGAPICIACATDKAVERASAANGSSHKQTPRDLQEDLKPSR